MLNKNLNNQQVIAVSLFPRVFTYLQFASSSSFFFHRQFSFWVSQPQFKPDLPAKADSEGTADSFEYAI